MRARTLIGSANRRRSNLDGASTGPALRDGDRLVLILHVHDGVAAHRLLRLHERTVADHGQVLLADATEAYSLRPAPEAVAFDDPSRPGVLCEPLADIGDSGVPLALRKRHPLDFDREEGEH